MTAGAATISLVGIELVYFVLRLFHSASAKRFYSFKDSLKHESGLGYFCSNAGEIYDRAFNVENFVNLSKAKTCVFYWLLSFKMI